MNEMGKSDEHGDIYLVMKVMPVIFVVSEIGTLETMELVMDMVIMVKVFMWTLTAVLIMMGIEILYAWS